MKKCGLGHCQHAEKAQRDARVADEERAKRLKLESEVKVLLGRESAARGAGELAFLARDVAAPATIDARRQADFT